MEPIESDVLLAEPIPYRIIWRDGTRETFLLPKLGVDGLIPWLDEITKARQDASRQALKKYKLGMMDSVRAEKSLLVNDHAAVMDLIGPIQTAEGIRRIIRMSLDKVTASTIEAVSSSDPIAYAAPNIREVSDAMRTQILESIMGLGFFADYLAKRLSTLFYFGGEVEAERAALAPKALAGGLAGPLVVPSATAETSTPVPPTTG